MEKEINEAIFEVYKAIRNSDDLPHELRTENSQFKFDLSFPSGMAIELFIETLLKNDEIEYLCWCRSGIYTSCEIFSQNLDYAINQALWSLLENKFCEKKESFNPFDPR